MQLTRRHWIEAALQTLGRLGVEAVRVEVLARELGVTKGSFYWHFKDRGDLLEAMISSWEEETRALFADVRNQPDPESRLARLQELVDQNRGRLPDYAIFSWARRDPEVNIRVTSIENERLQFLVEVARSGARNDAEAEQRAMFAYLAFIGWVDRSSRVPEATPSYPAFAVATYRYLFPGPVRKGSSGKETADSSRNARKG